MIEKHYKNNLEYWLRTLDKREYILAKKVGVETATICRYAKGNRLPNVVTALRISYVLGIPIDKIWPINKKDLLNW